jgi:hypothetical protein
MATIPEAIKGVPRIEGNPGPSLRADHNALADWVKANVHASFTSTGNRDADPLKWAGKVVHTQDTNSVWLCVDPAGSGTWFEMTSVPITAPAFTFASGWSVGAQHKVTRRGKQVTAQLHFHKTSAIGGSDNPVTGTPAGFVPALGIAGAGMVLIGGNAGPYSFTWNTGGGISIYGTPSGANTDFQAIFNYEAA